MLVRGHMRFDEEEHERMAELETRILVLEGELAELQDKLARTRKAEAELERTNSKLEKKLLVVGNRRARRDAMVNATEAFEEDLCHYSGPTAMNGRRIRDIIQKMAHPRSPTQEVDETDSRRAIREALMALMYVAQKDLVYPNVDLESILRK